MIASPARYSVFCVLVLGGLTLLAAEGAGLGLLPALLLLPLVAWPAWLALAYAAAVSKAQARSVLRDGASPWWAWALGGALWRQVLAVPVALLSAGSVGWWIIAEGWGGLGWIVAAALGLYPVAALMARQTASLKPYARLRPVLLLAPPVVAGGLTLVWTLSVGPGTFESDTLAEHIAAEPRYEGTSTLLAWFVDGMAVLSGARAWGLDWAEARLGQIVAMWRVGAAFGTFWLIAGVFAGLLLPPGEARRILGPSEADHPPPIGRGRLALVAGLLTVLSGALVSALAEAEKWATARQSPMAQAEIPGLGHPQPVGPRPALGHPADVPPTVAAPDHPTPRAVRRIVEAEQIGQLVCPPGSVERLQAIDQDMRDLRDARRADVEQAARTGFDMIRARVPAFLDGYYSLTAEYLRTFHLVAGDADIVLAREMAEVLEVDRAFAGFHVATQGLTAPLPVALQTARDGLLADCGFLPEDGAVLRVVATAPGALLDVAPDAEAIALHARLAASGAGAVAGVVAGTIVAKLVAKEAIGLAAEAAAKLALGKAAGGLGGTMAGAGAGALAGSVVPGIGTSIGAVVGGILGGLTVGAATDYALLEIEEAVSRDDFERQIQAAIDEAEAQVLGTLIGSN